MDRRDISKALLASAAGVALVSQRAQAQTCITPCYAATLEETAAAVTPVNPEYPPGNVLRYGTNAIPGTTPMDTAINNALKCNRKVHAPAGVYRITSSIQVPRLTELYGDGWGANGLIGGTVFLATTDIEIIASSNLDNESLPCVFLHDFVAQCTVTGGTTKYQIHLRNPNQTHIVRVKTLSGLLDTNYSTTNLAGIWLHKTLAGEGAYINRVNACFIQNGGLLIDEGVTDGTIIDNFIYGHCCAHGLKLNGAGGNWTISGNNLTSPPSAAAIEINSGLNNLIRIVDNFFDGNPAVLDSGLGIFVNAAQRVQIIGNTLWAMGKSGIRAVDPIGLIVSGNVFLNCNDSNAGFSDVAIVGHSFQSTMNVVSGNFFQQETSRVNKGCAIEEQNDGFNPVQNVYIGNQISANYLARPIRTLQGGPQAAKIVGNSGGGSDTELTSSFVATLTGVSGSVTGIVSYTRNGNLVTLTLPFIQGTSNASGATLTGLPASVWPANTVIAWGLTANNSVTAHARLEVSAAGTITLYSSPTSATFATSGSKGIVGATVSYSIT